NLTKQPENCGLAHMKSRGCAHTSLRAWTCLRCGKMLPHGRTRSAHGQSRLDTVHSHGHGHVTRARESVYIRAFPDDSRRARSCPGKVHPVDVGTLRLQIERGCK